MPMISPYKTNEYNARICQKMPFKIAKVALIASLTAKKKAMWEKWPINGRDYMTICFQLDDARRMQPPTIISQ